jgi:NAD(P)-dependent dehydrogenase (short-subunit alcohol dehydrogenase family)
MPDRASRFSLQGKRALVTGASRGIGAEIATVFADAGADVAIVGRDAKGLETTRQAIAGKGRRCIAIQADLGTVEGPRTAGTRAIELLGTVDILVNNAGVFHREPLLETTVEHWEETQAVNLRVAPGMMAQRAGKIINISSLAAQVGCDGHAAYSSSKGGLNMLTRVMAAEWGPFNIQTNAVAPTVSSPTWGRWPGATRRRVPP